MKVDRQALWQQLHAQGMVEGDMPEEVVLESPWYVRGLVGFSGWLTAGFLLLFIGAAFEFIYDNPLLAIVLGSGLLGLAYMMLAKQGANDFTGQFALAISFTGQSLVAYGLFDSVDGHVGLSWLLVAIMQFVLAWLMPNSLHRLWSAFAGSMASCFALVYGNVYFIPSGLLMAAVAFVWLREMDWLYIQDKIKPLAYGVTLALIYQGSNGQFSAEMRGLLISNNVTQAPWDQPWMGELLTGLVMLSLVWHLLKRQPVLVSVNIVRVTMACTLLLILASLEANGLSIGIMIMLLGYANGHRILTGLGIASLLFYISAYYYMLDTTLLEKSILLGLVGGLLIAMRFAMHYFLTKRQGVNHAD